METEEEVNKDFSPQKLLDKKVLCKRNGKIGKVVYIVNSTFMKKMGLLSRRDSCFLVFKPYYHNDHIHMTFT